MVRLTWYDSHGMSYMKPCNELDIDNYPLETNTDDNGDDNVEKEIEQKNKRSKVRIIRSVCFNKDVDSEKHYRELIMLFTSWRNENRFAEKLLFLSRTLLTSKKCNR